MVKILPLPTGPYIIGIDKRDLYDEWRKDPTYPQGQLIPVQFYFPLGCGQHQLYPKIFEQRAPKKFPPLEVKGYSKPISISHLLEGKHPLVILNHGNQVAMTDYAIIAEDLASHGYIVVTIQHQLETNPSDLWNGYSTSKHSKVIDNILYVFSWLKTKQNTLFKDKIDINKVCLIGQSMGGNALLMLANRTAGTFRKGTPYLLPREDTEQEIRECIIFIDGEFTYPRLKVYPILFCLSEERKPYQLKTGILNDLEGIGYQYHHYPGSRHISFMDHSWALPQLPDQPYEKYFNGTGEECKQFWKKLLEDIRSFLKQNKIS